MSRSKIFLSAIFLVMLVGPRTAMTAETLDSKPEASAPAGEENPECQKKVSNKGRPHKLTTVASLAAVSAWSQRAKKYGEEYTMWHNAKNQSLKCEKQPRSDYYVCFASGKPCRATNHEKTASSRSN